MSRITGQCNTECPVCNGIGYTRDTAPAMHTRFDEELQARVEFATEYHNMVPQLGSGCPRCLGTGQI